MDKSYSTSSFVPSLYILCQNMHKKEQKKFLN